MLRFLGNLFRLFLYLAVASLLGYYNFQINSWIGLITNVVFLIIGSLMVLSWKPKKTSDESSAKPSSSGTATAASCAETKVLTDKE